MSNLKKRQAEKRLQMWLDLLVEKQKKLQSLTLPYNLSLDLKECNLFLLSAPVTNELTITTTMGEQRFSVLAGESLSSFCIHRIRGCFFFGGFVSSWLSLTAKLKVLLRIFLPFWYLFGFLFCFILGIVRFQIICFIGAARIVWILHLILWEEG